LPHFLSEEPFYHKRLTQEAVMFQEHTLNINGVVLHYAEGPASGAPLVLLHGGSTRWQSLEPIMPALAQHWHLFAPDLRGHGQSAHVPGHYRLVNYVADTAAFLRAVVGMPAVVFGHSLGAQIALMLAAQHPDWVRAVISGDTPLSLERLRQAMRTNRAYTSLWRDLAGSPLPVANIADQLKGMPVVSEQGIQPARAVFGEDDPWYGWMAETLKQHDPTMLTAVLDDFENTHDGFGSDALFASIQCPVLVLQADPAHGGLLTDSDVQQVLPLLKHARHVMLPGVSHALHNQSPDAVLSAVVEFLETL
jgi:pimeloyl-ACP methyl ester carboxylesterase